MQAKVSPRAKQSCELSLLTFPLLSSPSLQTYLSEARCASNDTSITIYADRLAVHSSTKNHFQNSHKNREILTRRCVGIHWCLHHQWTSFWGHGDCHFPFFMFSKGCLHCFRVDIWKERGVKPELDRKELLFVHSAHLVQVHVCASWADNAHPMMEGQEHVGSRRNCRSSPHCRKSSYSEKCCTNKQALWAVWYSQNSAAVFEEQEHHFPRANLCLTRSCYFSDHCRFQWNCGVLMLSIF